MKFATTKSRRLHIGERVTGDPKLTNNFFLEVASSRHASGWSDRRKYVVQSVAQWGQGGWMIWIPNWGAPNSVPRARTLMIQCH